MTFGPDDLFACGPEGGGVAGRVVWDEDAGLISWFQPGGRQRQYEVEAVLEDSEERFAFRDPLGRKFVLFPLTPEHYNAHVRQPGTPQYGSMEALRYAYAQSLNNG